VSNQVGALRRASALRLHAQPISAIPAKQHATSTPDLRKRIGPPHGVVGPMRCIVRTRLVDAPMRSAFAIDRALP
jgi:hypothetical protein